MDQNQASGSTEIPIALSKFAKSREEEKEEDRKEVEVLFYKKLFIIFMFLRMKWLFCKARAMRDMRDPKGPSQGIAPVVLAMGDTMMNTRKVCLLLFISFKNDYKKMFCIKFDFL